MFGEVESNKHLKIKHATLLSSAIFGSVSCFGSHSSLLCACPFKRNKKNVKNKFFPFPSVEEFNLLKLLLPKAALSLCPGLLWFPFLDTNLRTIWYLFSFKTNLKFSVFCIKEHKEVRYKLAKEE